MPRSIIILLALLGPLFLALPWLSPPESRASQKVDADRAVAGDDDLVARVRRSIDEGVSFLKSQQRKTDGSWEIGNAALAGAGGWTALSVLALLNAGVKPEDEAIQKGLAYLRRIKADRTYVVGLQTMVFCLAKQKQDIPAIMRNVKWLEEAQMADGWSYTKLRRDTVGLADNSNTQYALLGLHEAVQAGLKVNPQTLRQMQEMFRRTQSNGGWSYRPLSRASTMTMTTAGLCNLIITGMDLAKGKAALRPDGSAENCGRYEDNQNIADALRWIGERFPARLTDETFYDRFVSPFYCIYGLERAGRLTGQRFFGGHDWYEIGCRYLVSAQKADGSWVGNAGPGGFDHWPIISTSFALLFLSKGRTPILISKMAYGSQEEMNWNNKRSDVRNLVEFTSRELFKGEPLAWQVYDVRALDAPTEASRRALAAQLLQSPIVYFNGHDFAPRDKEAEILREYLSNGGFVLAENCCGKERHPEFDRDFRRLIRELFPEAELRPLEPEHPVWLASGKFAISPRDFPLEGVKLGCKTIVIYSPVPLAGYWEANNPADNENTRKAFQLGANIVAYATGLEAPRPRLSKVELLSDNPREKIRRGFLQVGQIRHEGDWQPAPKAMRNLMGEARKAGLDVLLKTTPVYPGDDAVLDYRFLYLHGRNNFQVNKADLKKLRFNLRSGGVLFADACCGSRTFDTAFRKFVEELFAGDNLKLEPIPVNDDLFGGEINGEEIRMVKRRQTSADGVRVEPEFQSVRPALEGVKYRGRWVVIYSKYDIGCALEKHSSPDCLGHDHASAMKLGRAAVLYALMR